MMSSTKPIVRRHNSTFNAEWGNKVSILFGDMLFTHAFHLTSTVDGRACGLIGAATNKVCAGELLQTRERGNWHLSEEQYYAMVDGKTAALTEVSTRLGALYAGATPEVVENLATYGRSLGIAFQIADDLLDLTGEESKAGKTLGTDLEQQKMTLPLIHALQTLPAGESDEFRRLLRQPGIDKRTEVADTLIRSGSLQYAKRKAEEHARIARTSLECLPRSESRTILERIDRMVDPPGKMSASGSRGSGIVDPLHSLPQSRFVQNPITNCMRLHDTPSPKPDPRSLPVPEAARPKLIPMYAAILLIFHVLIPLAFFEPFFTWYFPIYLLVGNAIFGSIGINLAYHRLLTHRSVEFPRWLEKLFVLCGVCSLEGPPYKWVCTHRIHHQKSDVDGDPHSPTENFYWGHMQWIYTHDPRIDGFDTYAKYIPDLFRDPFLKRLHKRGRWWKVYLLHLALLLGVGAGVGYAFDGLDGLIAGAAQMFAWGIVMRTVYVWHITWFVNSAAHRWGYQNYRTGDQSRNTWWVALLTNGEGWHNNHHAAPRSASHGHRWWEIDLTFTFIRALSLIGWAKNVVPVSVPKTRLLPDATLPLPPQDQYSTVG